MIKVLNSGLNRLGVIKNVIQATRTEEINGENILDFEAVLDTKLNSFIDENSIFEMDDDYFDIASFEKSSNEDGTYTAKVESDHISYRLNQEQYNVEYFTEIGTPVYILGRILEGTGFNVGDVEYKETVTYSAQEPKSRRQLLMEFIALLGGEIIFNKFSVGILQHRGLTETKPVIKDRHVKVVSKSVNKRELDENGNYKIAYVCSSLYLPGNTYSLGDNVLLIQKQLGINERLRVVSISRNPYDDSETTMQFANYINGLESGLYRIMTSTVVKDKLYNGCRIGPEYGFEAVRSDKKARAYFRSDGLAMQSGDGTGENWRDRLYYAYDSETDETILVYDGKLSVDVLEVISGIITPYIYSENGAIVNAIVRRLRTDLSKPWRYLQSDSSDVHFQDIGDTDVATGRYFEVDYAQTDLPPVQFTMPSFEGRNDDSVFLWWFEGEVGGSLTTNPDYAKVSADSDPEPVMVYQYRNGIAHRQELKKTPEGYWGVREQWGIGEDEYARGAGILEKTAQHMQMIMDPGLGNEIGGLRISSDIGVELFNKEKKRWEYPGAQDVGNWDILKIGEDSFSVTIGQDVYDFQLAKDEEGRIVAVTDVEKTREVHYV